MRCEIPWHPRDSGVPMGGLVAAAGAAVAVAVVVAWLTANWVLVASCAAVVAAVAAGVAVAVAVVSRWSSRLALRSGTLAWRLAGYQRIQGELQRAPYQIPAPPLAVEPPARVLEGVVVDRERMRA